MVLDLTGLDGYYAFELHWTPAAMAGEPNAGPTLFTALQQQLGLRLESGKGEVPVLVIDRVHRTPAEN
jgi:uncharacterized protein (TIGR03435 family)